MFRHYTSPLDSEDANYLHVACERGHDVDVEAGHLVQAVERHRVLPGKDRDGNRTVAESKVDFEYQKNRKDCT